VLVVGGAEAICYEMKWLLIALQPFSSLYLINRSATTKERKESRSAELVPTNKSKA
jgi:hypothetical protein